MYPLLQGGGIYISSGNVILTASQIYSNTAYSQGPNVYVRSSATLCVFRTSLTGVYGTVDSCKAPPPLPPTPLLPPPLPPTPILPDPSPPPPMLPPPLPPPLSLPPPSLPPPSCASSTGRTYAYPCCANPTDAYAGRWINARWMDEIWFSTECSCIIRAGTDLPNGIAKVDMCCY